MIPPNTSRVPQPTDIKTLAGIQERKVKVQRDIQKSQSAAVNQLKHTADDAKDFAVNDLLLPAAGIAAGAFVLSKIIGYAFRSRPKGSGETAVAVVNDREHSGKDEADYVRRDDSARIPKPAPSPYTPSVPVPVPATGTSNVRDSSTPTSDLPTFITPNSAAPAPNPDPVKVDPPAMKKAIKASSVFRLGTLLIPAGQAIYEAIQKERSRS